MRAYTDPHVDVVKNEWLAGYQEVVARLRLKGKQVDLASSSDAKTWREIILRPIVDPGTKKAVDPTNDPGLFLETLAKCFNSSYLFATAPHDDNVCPFPTDRVLLTHAEPARKQVAAAGWLRGRRS